jgi:Cd2+/Zn2+-exporting ATPase
MGEKDEHDNYSGSYGNESCSLNEDHHDCGCGHEHNHEEDSIREYLLIAVSAILLACAISGGYIGLPETAVNILAVLSALCTGIPIIASSIKGLLGGRQSVCELAGIAIIGAILIGEYVTAAEVGLILSIGEIAEEFAYRRSRRDIEKIASVHPDHGLVEKGGETIEVPVDAIEIGDVALVRPGDIVPSDGFVISGSTSIDESCLTGESVPVEKEAGDPVYSGTTNINGAIRVEVLKKSCDSTYSRIVGFVREAEARRPPTYPFIEKFASIYTPLTLVITVLTWALTGSIERAITIIIVACPCALLLSTPSAVISAIGAGARRGILVKSGLYLEEAGKIDTVLFDKTGTLTSGSMSVKSVRAFGNFDEESVTALAAAAECGSEHPVAGAIVRYAEETGIYAARCKKTNSRPGLGVEAESDFGRILVGNARFLDESGISIPVPAQSAAGSLSGEGTTPVFVSLNGEIAGIFGIGDFLRKESSGVVAGLKDYGINYISMISGDKKDVAENIAEACGISGENVSSGVAPGEKKSIVEDFQSAGRTVCFVGDGVNDAPALAQANVGVSIGSRENTIAIETSHVVLLRNDLRSLLSFIRLGRKTIRTIKVNVAFALSFTFLLMVLAFFGVVHPAAGAIGHQFAVLAVLANSALIPFWIKDRLENA